MLTENTVPVYFSRLMSLTTKDIAVSRVRSHLIRVPFLIISIPMNAVGICFDGLQNIIGIKGMPYLFVIPNLLLYIIFGVLPILLNFHYGFSGGTSIIPSERPIVGTRNFEVLLDCRDYLAATILPRIAVPPISSGAECTTQ